MGKFFSEFVEFQAFLAPKSRVISVVCYIYRSKLFFEVNHFIAGSAPCPPNIPRVVEYTQHGDSVWQRPVIQDVGCGRRPAAHRVTQLRAGAAHLGLPGQGVDISPCCIGLDGVAWISHNLHTVLRTFSSPHLLFIAPS